MPRSTYRSLGVKAPLHKSQKRLYAYDGTALQVDGHIRLPCKYNGNTLTQEFYIVNTNSTPIVGLETCLALNLMKLVLATSETESLTKDNILSKYQDIFEGIGCLPGECEIHLRSDAIPVVHPPRRVPIALSDKLKAELLRMESLGVITKVTEPTDWVNSLVTVEKPDGSLRICLDPKHLNDAIKRPHYPNKTLDDILPDLSGAAYFSRFDARSGYWSLKLTESSSYLTTFNSPMGRWRFLRMAFGIRSAQDEFIKAMDQCLEGLDGVRTLVDDIVVFANDRATHDRNLEAFLTRCREKGIKLNPNKMEVGQTEIPFYGHVLSAQGLKIDHT